MRCSCGWGSDLFIKAHGAWNSYNRHKVIAEYEEEKLESLTIIRTAEELEALDAGTYLVDVCGEVMTVLGLIDTGDFPRDDTDMLAVIATEDDIRAARKALEDA